MADWINALEPHWFWLSIGVALGVIEILAPGFFLMWLGLAAIIVGLLSWLIPGMIIPMQVGLFAVLSVLTVYAGKRFLSSNPITSEDPALNDRGARLAGEVVTVVEAIENGRGRVKVGDSEWIARGADAATGSKVRVTGSAGADLLVEPV
jgi:membrane protein implicated in regulation of membrane protease activity